MRFVSVGHALFAATMIGLGILGVVDRDFTVIWQPVPMSVPARDVLVYVCAGLLIACGAGMLWRRTAHLASRVLQISLLVWLLVFRLPPLFQSLGVEVYWAACSTGVMLAAAWVLSDWFAGPDKQHLGFIAGDLGQRIARALYGAAIIPFGIAHFSNLNQTAAQVPNWLPAHVDWVYFTGGAFIVAGIAVLVGVYARLAAALSALQMALFLLLVWVPVVATATGPVSPFQRDETVISWALAVAGWVVAESYRGIPWFSPRTR